jgi:hypothetical protein
MDVLARDRLVDSSRSRPACSAVARREFFFNNVPACQTTSLGNVVMPQTQAQGDIPLTAISTGSVDSMECVLLKMGVDQSEFTTPTGGGRIHMYEEQRREPHRRHARQDHPDGQQTQCGHAIYREGVHDCGSMPHDRAGEDPRVHDLGPFLVRRAPHPADVQADHLSGPEHQLRPRERRVRQRPQLRLVRAGSDLRRRGLHARALLQLEPGTKG